VAVFHRDFELLARENLGQPLAKSIHQSLYLTPVTRLPSMSLITH
jgi:hypothetical protein